jgi:hypothetical protein
MGEHPFNCFTYNPYLIYSNSHTSSYSPGFVITSDGFKVAQALPVLHEGPGLAHLIIWAI